MLPRLALALALAFALALAACPVLAADPKSCAPERMADLGWTDIVQTNTTADVILSALGYQPSQTLLGLEVSVVSLREGNMDIFQGNWRPEQSEQYKAFLDDGSVEVPGQNLAGTKITPAVPMHVSDAGVKSFADLAAHADRLGGKIYAIAPGSNQPLLDTVAVNRHGQGERDIVESREAGMLSPVGRKGPKQEWGVFLGWEPHPMNLNYDLTYPDGGDIEIGPNSGGATMHSLSRRGSAAECPNAARLFSQLVFDLDCENLGMQKITGAGMAAPDAARAVGTARPEMLEGWLDGVTTLDGQPGRPGSMAPARRGAR
jgi:glycine betaine/proline transport system substrate-binding protein